MFRVPGYLEFFDFRTFKGLGFSSVEDLRFKSLELRLSVSSS